MDEFTYILGFAICFAIIIGLMLIVLYLIKNVNVKAESAIKKADLIHKKLVDLKYR